MFLINRQQKKGNGLALLITAMGAENASIETESFYYKGALPIRVLVF
jgi:hypothetical protein